MGRVQAGPRPTRRLLRWTDVAAVIVLAGGYFAVLWAVASWSWFQNAVGMATSPWFPFVWYLLWLPSGVPIYLILRRVIPATPGPRSILFSVLFAPTLMGVYMVFWAMPLLPQMALAAWMAAREGGLSPLMASFLIVYSALPAMIFWFFAYLAMRVRSAIRSARAERGRL